jgi:hypothetical protein
VGRAISFEESRYACEGNVIIRRCDAYLKRTKAESEVKWLKREMLFCNLADDFSMQQQLLSLESYLKNSE